MLFMCGCARQKEPVLPSAGDATLRDVIQQKERSVQWTADVDPAQQTRTNPAIAVTPENVFAERAQYHQIVYPELFGFGSLDTSLLGSKEQGVITPFCEAITAHDKNAAAQLMNTQSAFLLTIFFDDIRDIEFSKRYIIGRPGIRGNMWQIPVRFFLDDGILDVHLFLNQGESIQIDQISYGEIIHDNTEQP
jgi:hypothetical protein